VGSWDRGRIEQVVTNLLDNAAKYSPPGQPITVSVARGPEPCMVRLEVQDHGIGIPPDEAPHLFERHFRGSNVARSSSGLGLGLYLSAKIIHLHGGRIWADSVVRQGSTFHVTLPLEIPAP
ncbi:MAG: ATP-binding protein, partial [Chloroflexi bacterium]|nr:ATP-binding protein [Chloroflexota bacterium]